VRTSAQAVPVRDTHCDPTHPGFAPLESLADFGLDSAIEPWTAEFLSRRLCSRQARADTPWIIDRSNSAKTLIMPNIALPDGVVVSRPC
jgi:hypothetical protein